MASWQVVVVRQALKSWPVVIWHLVIWPIVIVSFGPTTFFVKNAFVKLGEMLINILLAN
jgi:hypothetical protein